MNPELLRPQSEKISRIFFSATVKDCKGYRNEVKDAIVHRIPGTTVHLQEHWVGAWNDVVDRCLRELNDSHAYFGLFGFRYGWVPKGQGCSITELEFKAACDKWRGPSADAPIFIFLPDDCSKKEPSKAAIDLLALAEQVLDEEFGADERKKQRSRRSQDRLRKRVSSGQTVNWFRDSQHLREQAITCVLNYNTTILESALRAATEARGARRPGPTRIPNEELGIIGREPQLNALEEALGQVRMATDVPGACILVHGLENSGHRQFAAFLKDWEGWELAGSEPFVIRPRDATDRSVIVAAMAECLGRDAGQTWTIDLLANAIIDRCETDNVVFIIDDIGSYIDSLRTFQRQFWAPLEQALRDRWLTARKKAGRYTMIIVDHALLDDKEAGTYVRRVNFDNSSGDYQLLVALPPLTHISKADVAAWLKTLAEHGWNNLKQQVGRLRIAKRVTQTRDGRPEGLPLHVYDRLECEDFWDMS